MAKPDLVFWAAPVRKRPFVDQVRAAQAGGFDSMAVAPTLIDDERERGRKPKDLLAIAADHGVVLRHLDTCGTWAPVDLDPRDFDEEMRARWNVPVERCLRVCEELGLVQILAVAGYQHGQVELPRLVDGFADLCERAGRLGIWVDLEPQPFSGCASVPEAWAIVGGTGARNAGVLMDTWHFHKWDLHDLADLDPIPGRCLRTLQIADAPRRQVRPKLIQDTLELRRWPGEGELPLVAFLRAVAAKGGLKAVGQEVFSLEADAMGAEQAGRKAGETTRAILAAAGIDVGGRKGEGFDA